MKLVVLSCDKYEPCWKPFFTLLEKYYPHHPEVYLITETKNGFGLEIKIPRGV